MGGISTNPKEVRIIKYTMNISMLKDSMSG